MTRKRTRKHGRELLGSLQGALGNGGGHWQPPASLGALGAGRRKSMSWACAEPCEQREEPSVGSNSLEKATKKKVWSFLMDESAEHPPPVKCGQEGNVRAWELQDGVRAACVFGTAAAAASGVLRPVVMPSVLGGW